jgi:vacuolar-type H+-ATPase subunit H
MDDGPKAERFMDEPSDVGAGLDDSLASEVADRVMKVVEDAERDAEAITAQSEDEADALLERARSEARRIREDAARQARALGTDRVRRILELRREIGAQAEELAALSEDPQAAMAEVNRFLEALTARADEIGREIAVEASSEAPDGAPAPADRDGHDGTAAAVDAALAAVAAEPSPEPLRETRLEALRMAVAGASRTELERELTETLDPKDATAVLDDVFGRPKSPFPKWDAAVKRAG